VLALSWIAAFNLRAGFIGLGPALPALTDDLGLSYAQASFLVAVPTLMMGLLAVPGGALADRWGPGRVIAGGLALVAVGGGLRAVAPEFGLLLALTVLFGAGIGLSQPPLPRLMRSWFPGRVGVTTGIYASGMIVGSITGASLTGPLMARLGEPAAWRAPLALWGVLAAAAFIVWVAIMRPWRAAEPGSAGAMEHAAAGAAVARWSPWSDRRAWLAAALFATQGLVYYLLVAWLPAVYDEAGASATLVAALFAVFNAATLPAILLFPAWSDFSGGDRRRWWPARCCWRGHWGSWHRRWASPGAGSGRGSRERGFRDSSPWRWCCRPTSRLRDALGSQPAWCWASGTPRRRWGR
jgi:CP family cyanate transporter-like MFS transporter